jgi:glutamate dehydrogenase
MIDLLIPGQTPGIKEQLVDLYGKPELLFFGPDGTSASFVFDIHVTEPSFLFVEGTADMMDWAAGSHLKIVGSADLTKLPNHSARP